MKANQIEFCITINTHLLEIYLLFQCDTWDNPYLDLKNKKIYKYYSASTDNSLFKSMIAAGGSDSCR